MNMAAKPLCKPSVPAVRELLEGLFDYAGLFPPATLPMPEAVREFVGHLSGGESWMAGAFVCPVSRIEAFIAERITFEHVAPVKMSILPAPVVDAKSFGISLRSDLTLLAHLSRVHPGLLHVEALEIRVPGDASRNPDAADSFLSDLLKIAAEETQASPRLFLEVARDSNFTSALSVMVSAAAGLGGNTAGLNFKIRCGGATPADYPSSAELAFFIATVISSSQSFKATAGLHHPIRHLNDSAGTMMHGFLNVFFAAVICSAYELDAPALVPILEEEDPSHFRFVDAGLQFHDYFVSTDDVQRIRSSRALSIGSCSINEPKEDLYSLKWLKSV